MSITDEARAELANDILDRCAVTNIGGVLWHPREEVIDAVVAAGYRKPEAAPSATDEPTEREKVLDEVFTNLADQGWDVAIADDPVKGVSIDIQPVPSDTDKDTFTASNGYKVDRLADGQTKITRSTNGAFEAVTWCGGDEYLAIAEHALSRSQPVQVDPREVAHIECDCVPDIGPSHCHLCSERAGHPVPWSEAHPQPVQVEVTDNTKLIDRAREMRMDAEVGTHVERMRILGELANALQASDAALSAALGGGPVACNCTHAGAHDYGSAVCESGTPQPSTVTEERAGYLGERSVDAQNTLSLGVIDAPEFLVEAVGRIARERGVSRATAVRQLLAARLTPAQPERNAICAECGCVGYHAINCPAARLTPAHPEQVTGVLAEIQAEVVRSTEKHGDQNHLPLGTGDQVSLLHGQELAQPFEHVPVTMGTFAYTARNVTDDAAQGGCVTWADILLEEVAEALAEDSPTGVRAEAVQVAAVAVKIINAIDAAAVTPESGEKR